MNANLRTAKFLMDQMDALKREYDELVAKERAEVLRRIVESIRVYGITPDEIMASLSEPTPDTPEPSKHTGSWVKNPGKRPIRYRDGKGNEWTGWSRVPLWVREYEAKGGSREDFRVKGT